MSRGHIDELRGHARAAVARGDLTRARSSLREALSDIVAKEVDYVGATGEMRDVLVRDGDYRAALTLDWYGGTERSQSELLEHVPAIDRARTLMSWAQKTDDPARAREMYARAADEFESGGSVAQAAIARERGEDFVAARALWSRLSQLLASSGTDLYAAGLARFNLARTSRRTNDEGSVREAMVSAVHLLEEAADRYETIGQRERAFDCFQVLIAVGRDSGEFEHVLEGYVNVIRILREDNLRYYALQSYEEALEAAEQQGEVSAAATLAREMAIYARKEGLVTVANHGLLTQARLWQSVAEACLERGSAAQIAENALLAAVIAYGEAGQYERVGAAYGSLAELPLEESRKTHYERARHRYDDAEDLPIAAAPLPAHLRHDAGFPEVWHVDLVEWEQRGSAAEACGDIVLDAATWSDVSRRHAMLARLTALEVEEQLEAEATADPAELTENLVQLTKQLANVDYYIVLAALESLYLRREAAVRIEVVRTLSRFLFKRTFITLRDALADPDSSVVGEAARALEELRFPHAFDPLARIYRESQVPEARISALRALAKMDTVEAAEMLLGVIEHDAFEEREAVVEALKRSARGVKFVDLARSALPTLTGPAQIWFSYWIWI